MSVKLINEIEKTPDKIKLLSNEDLSSIIMSSVDSGNMTALKILMKNYTGIQ